MAILTATMPTLVDLAKMLDPDGKIADIVQMLDQENEFLSDLGFMEGNNTTGHRISMQTGLPASAFRRLNQGTVPSKGTTAQIDEQCALMDEWAQCDVELAKLSGDIGKFRLNQALPHMSAMGIKMASTIIYGSAADDEEFVGLASRYNLKSAGNGGNIVDAGGTGSDNTSVWVVCSSPTTFYGIVPKGSQVGLQHEDKGIVTLENAGGVTGALLDVYRDKFTWKAGIALPDWRYVVRIANIDVSAMIADSTGATVKLLEYITRALHRIPNLSRGRVSIWANRTVRAMLDIQATNKAVYGLTLDTVDGKPRTAFRGYQFRTVDALLETEARVV